MTSQIIVGDALEEMRLFEPNTFDLIATDPPYNRVKDEEWDRQWATADDYLSWLDNLAAEWQRLLKPNGSLYVFASPQMAARVECTLRERFNVLNRIRWLKDAGWHNKTCKTELRALLSPWEEILFVEHYGADNMAKGEAGYAAKCDELRGFVFEPLRAYLAGEFDALGWNGDRLNEICGTASMAAHHYTARSQWCLPTAEHYAKLQVAASPGHLRREYEDLRREYEDLRRPFNITPDVPYTDVWTFRTVQAYPGKHPCEKPVPLMRHIVNVSSRPGALVMDCFAGSGTTGVACAETGRDFIGIELNAEYAAMARRRIAPALAQPALLEAG